MGDFCLDRYLEIDPRRSEVSIETGLPVYNVVKVRAQAGAAGTILNNLVALGVGAIYPIGFCGEDSEGNELRHALAANRAVRLDGFLETKERVTFSYGKPLIIEPGKPPRELNRFDTKNWSPTPGAVEESLIDSLMQLSPKLDAIIVLDQVDMAGTGVVTPRVLKALGQLAEERPKRVMIGDSRRGLRDWPTVAFKMNAAELATLTGEPANSDIKEMERVAGSLARRHGRSVFVTLAERGIIGATPAGEIEHAPALPLRGPIDIVGAGDAVSANLAVSLAAGATLKESLEIANAAASDVIHQLGTTGAATTGAIGALLMTSQVGA
jgi:rfaE bifunctional protein kinase chain/domain